MINTMGMSVLERVREIGLLRAVGLDRRDLAGILRVEAVIISLFGCGLGLLAGGVIGAAGVRSTAESNWPSLGGLGRPLRGDGAHRHPRRGHPGAQGRADPDPAGRRRRVTRRGRQSGPASGHGDVARTRMG
ncbi:ABC transporter permease [Streptomyces sp. M19]